MRMINHAPGSLWESVGHKVSFCANDADVLYAANLDWKVKKLPLISRLNMVESVVANGYYHLIRENIDGTKPISLSISPEEVPYYSNGEVLAYFNRFIKDSELKLIRVGEFDDGKHIWFLAKAQAHDFYIESMELIECYVLFTYYHSYGKKPDYKIIFKRNQSGATLVVSKPNQFRLNHQTKFTINQFYKNLKEDARFYRESILKLTEKYYTENDIIEFLHQIYPRISNEKNKNLSMKAVTVKELIKTQPARELFDGTWWQAVAAVWYDCDFKSVFKKDLAFKNAFYGQNSLKKLRALDFAVAKLLQA